jgi:hypothetical protein
VVTPCPHERPHKKLPCPYPRCHAEPPPDRQVRRMGKPLVRHRYALRWCWRVKLWAP